MIYIGIILIIISCCLLYLSTKKYKAANEIEIAKNNELQKQIAEYQEQERKREKINQEIQALLIQQDTLYQNLANLRKEQEEWMEHQKAERERAAAAWNETYSYAAEQYEYALEQACVKAEQDFDKQQSDLQKEIKDIEDKLQTLKNTLTAGVEAQLREREKEQQLDFYRLKVSEQDLSDIKTLNTIKSMLFQPVILSKLIWSTYFQKQTTELCNRILGLNKKCGIYKITNILTEQCYIGQSVDIATRWKDHMKCGLGIEASATNKLYNAMQADGVWNFTFELLEECSRELLNEKEKFWINMYQSDKFGYNSTKGNK